MIAIQYLIPELILSTSIFSLLIIGVFIKNSFNIIYRLSTFVIFLLILIIISDNNDSVKIFNKSFILDEFASFSKILILVSSFFVLLMSKKYILDIKNNKFEYPIIILLSILGMFLWLVQMI